MRSERKFDACAAAIKAIDDDLWPAAKERANLICSNRQSGLQPVTVAVIALVMSVVRRQAGYCLHSALTISKAVGYSEKQVRRALKEAQKYRYLVRREVPGNKHFPGSKNANRTRVWETSVIVLADAADQIRAENGGDKKSSTEGTNKSNGGDKQIRMEGTNKSQWRGQECPPITEDITVDITDSPPTPLNQPGVGENFTRHWDENDRRAIAKLRSCGGDSSRVIVHFLDGVAGLLGPPKDVAGITYAQALVDELGRYSDVVLQAVAERTRNDRKYRLPPIPDVVSVAKALAPLRRAGIPPPKAEVGVFRKGSPEYAVALERARVKDPPRAEAIETKGWVKCYPLHAEHT